MSNKTARQVTRVALAIALPAITQHAIAQTELPTVKVTAENASPYLNTNVSSPKRTQSQLDSAKTTQVITEQTLREQNLLSLQDALMTTPGISFGAGEGGGGYSDKINLRGMDAQYNTTVDGLRDAAMQTRSDLFNYEAIEITKGANASEGGVGQFSGGVNLATKAPQDSDFTRLSSGIGTDNYLRFTADSNKVVNEDVAVRVNLMAHQNDHAGREEEKKRWGIATALAYNLSDKTKLTFSQFHQQDHNDPLYGVQYFNGKPVPGISPADGFGYRNLDEQLNHTNTLGVKIESQLADNIQLTSMTRYSNVLQDMTVSATGGITCLANGWAPSGVTNDNPSGYSWADCGAKGLFGQYLPGGPRGYHRETQTKQLAHDTNVLFSFDTGSIKHDLVVGAGGSWEDYSLVTGGYLYKRDGTAATRPPMNPYDPYNVWTGPTNYQRTSVGDGSLDIRSVYAFDTLTFSPQWQLNVGVRHDRVEGEYKTTAYAPDKQTYTLNKPTEQTEDLFSWNTGLTYKPMENWSIYAAYSDAMKPVQNNANAGCTEAAAGATTGTCGTDPEEAKSYELGTKWQPHDALMLTAAIFRNEQNKARVASTLTGVDQVNDAKNHIDGIEVGASGNITEKWGVSASFAYMKGEYDQTAADSFIGPDYGAGSYLINVPKYSGGLWTSYKLDDKWQLGYGLTYQGQMYLSQVIGPSNTTAKASTYNYLLPQVQSEDYFVHNASVSYIASPNLNFQLNIKNLLNEEFYTNIRNNGWAMPGETRSVILTANYEF